MAAAENYACLGDLILSRRDKVKSRSSVNHITKADSPVYIVISRVGLKLNETILYCKIFQDILALRLHDVLSPNLGNVVHFWDCVYNIHAPPFTAVPWPCCNVHYQYSFERFFVCIIFLFHLRYLGRGVMYFINIACSDWLFLWCLYFHDGTLTVSWCALSIGKGLGTLFKF